MTDNRIRSMVKNFRKKIDLAQSRGLFAGTMLEEFPTQCCGIASRLLAEFLLGNGIETLWISAEEFGTQETHAWLVVKDYRIDPPRSCFDDMPNSIIDLLCTYGGGSSESIRESTFYEKQDIENGLIIDITGDQFNEVPIYVGYMDDFHKRFDFVAAFGHEGLLNKEYAELYEIIMTQ